jgi:hypothetical protein
MVVYTQDKTGKQIELKPKVIHIHLYYLKSDPEVLGSRRDNNEEIHVYNRLLCRIEPWKFMRKEWVHITSVKKPIVKSL